MGTADSIQDIINSGLFTLTDDIKVDPKTRLKNMPKEFYDYFDVENVATH